MAVIESKGNGYSLYNGVKLRSLPEAIGETHPNIMIYTNADGSVYSGIASTVPYKHSNSVDNGSGTLFEGFYADGGSRKAIPFKNGDWVYLSTSTSGFSKMSIETVKLVWSNFDILDEDGSVYFAASEPISLDGMNVIEWDGDTTGLEAHAASTYYVSNNTDVDSSKMGVFVRSSTTGESQTFKRNFTIVDNFCHILNTVGCVFEASETLPTVGIYIYAKSAVQRYVSLFAYYPIESSDTPSDSDGEKTNIHFNNKDYSVNNSSLALHSADLKSHLSTVMNGTGAIIKLGDVAYNVDATKLANARNAFVQHLGTISGNDYKVVIGGVEYGIDAGKVAEAIVKLTTVLEGLHDGSDEYDHNAPELHPNDGTTPTSGEVYNYGDYTYTYNGSGWEVAINEEMIDKNQTSYGPILESINGKPVVSLLYTFEDCSNLTEAPVIPNSVTNMQFTFLGCSSLTETPIIPQNVTSIIGAFRGCKSLTKAPAIPNSVTSMLQTFMDCTNFKTYVGSTDADGDFSNYAIPDSVTNIDHTFCGCANLTKPPVIPESVTNMKGTFSSCTNLTDAPIIPDSVTNMDSTFSSCTSLNEAPVIPEGVTNMDGTFYCCKKLTGTIEINANPADYAYCFYNVDMSNITLTGTSALLNEIGATGKNWTPTATYAATFADNDWSTIAHACQNNEVPDTWAVGDVKTMMIGENEVEIMIIGKNHDEYADGGTAPLTFMTKQVIGTAKMNSTNTNVGGWDESEMYTYLNNETDGVITTLSADVQAAIKPVVKTTTIGNKSSETETSNDKLFLLSDVEVTGSTTSPYNLEGTQYSYFANGGSMVLKNLSGYATSWWLRSPNAPRNNRFHLVGHDGTSYIYPATSSYDVAFGFCF